MRAHGLQGAHLRRGWKHGSTRQDPSHTAAPDLVDRDFRVEAPNRLWVAALTRLLTGQGVLWLASVRDAFANRVVGWATDPRASAELVLTALNHALRSRDVRAGQLIPPQRQGRPAHRTPSGRRFRGCRSWWRPEGSRTWS
jgi:putative transposase